MKIKMRALRFVALFAFEVFNFTWNSCSKTVDIYGAISMVTLSSVLLRSPNPGPEEVHPKGRQEEEEGSDGGDLQDGEGGGGET